MNQRAKAVTFYLAPAAIKVLDAIYAHHIINGRKVTKSALLTEAIKLLQEDREIRA